MTRVAQLVLLVPLGLFQLAAVIAFSVSDGLTGWDWPVAAWGVLMSASCAAVAVRLRRSARARRAAWALLVAQGLFSLVKLLGYGEHGSFVFLGLVAVAAVGLAGRRAAVAAVAALVVVPGALGATALPALSDEFDGVSLTGWSTMNGEDFGDGTAHEVSVVDGALQIVPVRSWWVDDKRALYIWKNVTGDFVATMRVQVTGTKTADPQANWSLSGILVRNPASTKPNENWLAFRTGFVNGSRVYERKTTLRSHSILVLASAPSGWVDLRVARVGARFFLLKRNGAGTWVEHWSYVRPDLPKMLEVGIDGFSGDESPHADMVSRVDWFHFAPTGVPAKLRGARDAKLVPYLAHA